MAKQLTCQKYIFKINSSRLRKSKWKLTLPLSEARKNEELISLADSQILRWLDELNGIVDADDIAREIKTEIKFLRKQDNNIQNRRLIKSLYSQLDDVQFKSDYLFLIIDKESDYRRACKGFSINGIRYQRLLGTNGGVKNETIVFIADRHAEEIKRRNNNSRNLLKPMVPAKFESYKALICSASTPVSMPRGVLVVDDCVTEFLSDIVYLDDECDGEPEMSFKKDYPIQLDESDGYGIMLPSLAARWSEELCLDYIVGGVNTRFAWEKGMVFTFDFIDFATNVARSFFVQDAWGHMVDIRAVELILTTSMVKLWDSYDSCASYLDNCLENQYTFGITKCCPKSLESERRLNYQFIQSYDLDNAAIDKLIQPTIDSINDVLYADAMKSILFLKGVGLNEENIACAENDYAKAIMIEQSVLQDSYVQSSIFQSIKNKINEAKVGAIKVHGNYSIACGDPYALCQSIFGMPVTGLLRAGEVYNKYWANCGASKLACFRAPMTCHNNIRKVMVHCSPEAEHWYQYMTTCTLFNAWDTAAHALNGMD